ncbi:MAG: hypothetical protein WCC44_07990 [Azonexus sp.]|jgi:hypothetical protein
MLRPTSESPAAKVLGSQANPGLIVLVKTLSTALGGFCLYAAFKVLPSFIANPDLHGSIFLGMFLLMAGLGFSFWVPSQRQRLYFSLLAILLAVMEVAVNIGIAIK